MFKHCPFCGGKASRNDDLTEGVEGVVFCERCGAAAFISEWNHRVPSPEAEALAEAADGALMALNNRALVTNWGTPIARLNAALAAYCAKHPKEGSAAKLED